MTAEQEKTTDQEMQEEQRKTTSRVVGLIKDVDFNVDLLQIYYEKAFPYDLMYKWLSYSKFAKKESRMLHSL